jgi:hypothetical protein
MPLSIPSCTVPSVMGPASLKRRDTKLAVLDTKKVLNDPEAVRSIDAAKAWRDGLGGLLPQLDTDFRKLTELPIFADYVAEQEVSSALIILRCASDRGFASRVDMTEAGARALLSEAERFGWPSS